MRKIIAIIALTMLSGIVLGQTRVKIGQLYYQSTGDNTVSVVPELPRLPFYNAGNAPTGDITIPPTVEIEGRTYTVTAIGEWAFDDCSGLTAITIPNTVTTIKDWAFADCSFTNITIPSSVTSIGEGMLAKCPQLTSINVDAANPAYTSQDGVLYSKDKTHLYIYPTKKAGAFAIPYSVTTVGKYAFINCSEVTSIDIPSSVTNIKEGAFWRCPKLKEVTVNWATPLRRLSDIFYETPINNATLRVPIGMVGQYNQADRWRNFRYIREFGISHS